MCEDDGGYASEIDRYLRNVETEEKRMPRADYLKTVQTKVTASMRAILVDWLVSLAKELQLAPDTPFRTISYIDRFLSFRSVATKQLQLLGVSAMLIASKYEDIRRATASQFSYYTDWTYSTREVVNMERDILKVLQYEIGNPTAKTFLRRFVIVAREDVEYSKLLLEFLANYLAELTLLDYDCIGFLPSIVAASAVFLARFTIKPKRHPWSKQLAKYTEYAAPDLKDCITAVHSLQLNKGFSLANIPKKYKDHTFKCVSSLRSPEEIPARYFDGTKEDDDEEEEEDDDEEADEEDEESSEEEEEEEEEGEGEEYEEYEEEINSPPSKKRR